MKKYMARATKVNENGNDEVLLGDKSEKMYDAYRTLKEWGEALGERLKDREIEVYGKVKKLYTIHVTNG